MVSLRQLTITRASNNEPSQTTSTHSATDDPEIVQLKRNAWFLVAWLIILLIFTLIFLIWGLAEAIVTTFLLIGLCTAAGLGGSTISVLISVAERLSNGMELEDGRKVPEDANKPDMFGQRMVPWFVIRPFLGAVMGLAVYLGLSSGLFMFYSVGDTTNLEPSILRLTFLSLLAGLFAKSFLESLKRAFAAFVGDKI